MHTEGLRKTKLWRLVAGQGLSGRCSDQRGNRDFEVNPYSYMFQTLVFVWFLSGFCIFICLFAVLRVGRTQSGFIGSLHYLS